MDNQLALELAWLAGAMDSDGCFSAPVQHKRRTFKAYPDVKFANTNDLMTNEVMRILMKLGIRFLVEEKAAKRSHKKLISIRVRRLNEIANYLPHLIPYLIGKKAQAQLLLEFVESRIRRTGLKYNDYWNEAEKNFLARIHLLNTPGRREKRGVNDCTASALFMHERKVQSSL